MQLLIMKTTRLSINTAQLMETSVKDQNSSSSLIQVSHNWFAVGFKHCSPMTKNHQMRRGKASVNLSNQTVADDKHEPCICPSQVKTEITGIPRNLAQTPHNIY